ncbi:MAG TPA: DUF4399 domain-containing protein [Xanthomonadaceae bacterium]|nr:DUF4399 domain-containing protein [Xanthomonadaceae bacterium]
MTGQAFLAAALLAFATTAASQQDALERRPAPEGAEVYFIQPKDGAVLPHGPIKVKFGLRGMGVAPAGIDFRHTGHHHLLIDLDQLPDFDQPIPADARHVHFGMGQTETTIELAPGTHTLQLLLGDWLHIPHDPPVLSERITITVTDDDAQ